MKKAKAKDFDAAFDRGEDVTQYLDKSKKQVLYRDQLAGEWSEWVEAPNPEGSREKELFPEIRNWLARVNPKNLLDIGCGQGVLSTIVPPQIDYYGVDVSEPLIARASQIYSSPKRTFEEGDAYQLPFEAATFDAAISFWVWSHLKSPANAAVEMSRVLKNKGYCLVITANPETYDVRRTFYSTYEENGGLLIGDFNLGNGKKLSQTTLYLHRMTDFSSALDTAGLVVKDVKRVGMLDEYPDGLYVILSAEKD
jgi:ubiquinone/menaquinone biosynthesis C-methylase UbiE